MRPYLIGAVVAGVLAGCAPQDASYTAYLDRTHGWGTLPPPDHSATIAAGDAARREDAVEAVRTLSTDPDPYNRLRATDALQDYYGANHDARRY